MFCLHERNRKLVDEADHLIAVYDGKQPGGTRETIVYARRKGLDITIIEPYVFFDDVLRELGYKLNYEAVVNYAGNAFCEKSWDMIEKSNLFNIADGKNGSQAMSNLAGFFGKSTIRIMGGKSK